MTSRYILNKLPHTKNNHYNIIQRSIATTYSNKPAFQLNDFTLRTLTNRNTLVQQNCIQYTHNQNDDNRYYSSTTIKKLSQQQEPSIFDRFKSKLSFQSPKKESDEAAQFKRLADMEQFTMKDFQNELENSRTWKEKVFGSILDKDNKARIDKVLKLVQVLNKELPVINNNTSNVLEIGRKEKIRICMKTNDDSISLDDLNEVLKLYNNMEYMHRLLRYRKVNGKGVPESEEGMRLAAEEDQKNIVTNREKKIMKQKMMRGVHRMKK